MQFGGQAKGRHEGALPAASGRGGCRTCVGIPVEISADGGDAAAADDAVDDGQRRLRVLRPPALAHVEKNPSGLPPARGVPFF